MHPIVRFLTPQCFSDDVRNVDQVKFNF